MFFRSASDKKLAAIQDMILSGKIDALNRSQAVIEFELDGTIISANDGFLKVMGYESNDIVGRHHSMFVDPEFRDSPSYKQFWDRLRSGDFVSDKFKRIGRGGRVVWIQASYNPLLDGQGKPFRVVKFATDITAGENERADRQRLDEAAAQSQLTVVTALAKGLNKLAEGDLLQRIDGTFSSEFDQLRLDFNTAADTLQKTLTTVSINASSITSGLGEISTAAADLSRRTEQQAASLEETAAALDEITATVRKSADGASHARQVVATAAADAEQSSAVVRQAVQAMDAIETSSKQISQIIGVIDEIAFQTNLLALNAGVEAARAGDAGRGFAVVASEVRGLAQRSAEAAKEIKALISASSTHVGQGVDLVAKTGAALERIAVQVAEINSIVADIAVSAKEQSTALNEVNTAINQMDQVTQQNAAMVEQSTAASQQLTEQANQLTDLIGGFDLGDRPVERSAPGKPSRAPTRVVALKTTGRGGAARKVQPTASEWAEF